MAIKKEVLELIDRLKQLKIGSGRWNTIINTLQTKYEMTSWTILGLYSDPPTLEYTTENRHLLLEPEVKEK